MTCIVGIAKEGRVYIGGDSLGSSGWDSIVQCDKKVFSVGDAIMGLSGSPRAKQLLQYHLKLPDFPEGEFDLMRYMVADFSEAVRKCWRDGGYLEKDKERESGNGSCFLVGLRGRLFRVESTLQVIESLWDFDAIGIGAGYALGSLLRSDALGEDVDTAIYSALTAAEQFSNGVRRPFHILSEK